MSGGEEIRIDVIRRDTHRLELRIYSGETLLYTHTIELNPEVFDEEEATQIMNAWAKVLQLQVYSLHSWEKLIGKIMDIFSDEDYEEAG